MQSASELTELGQDARNAGRTAEALVWYEQAVAAFEAEGEVRRAAHARRHSADLQREVGLVEEARRSIGVVVAFYRENGTGALEMANSLRIAALVEEDIGAKGAARGMWAEALGLYDEAGVQVAVDECRRRLS